MKDIWKRLTALTLVLVLVAGLTACTGGDNSSSGSSSQGGSSSSEGSAADSSTASTPDDGEKQTSFKIFAGVSELSPDNSEKPIVADVNEAKGITIEWNCVSGDTLTEKKNLMLNAGSGSMPDAFMAAQLKDAEIMTCGTKGLFIPLEDYQRGDHAQPHVRAGGAPGRIGRLHHARWAYLHPAELCRDGL